MRHWFACLLCTAVLVSGGCHAKDSPPRAAVPEPAAAAAIGVDHHIVVDQFGYLPDEKKIAVIREPRAGYDREDSFQPGDHYQVRRAEDGQPVFSGTPVLWSAGATDESSGDRGRWFDFSVVTTPGRFFVMDVDRNVRSPAFNIGAQVYRGVLKAATRMYFYQRGAFAKRAPYAEPCWTDQAAYVGKNQDKAARDITDRDNVAKIKDVSGGWFDAGDTNKYVTFAAQAVHQLLTAYSANPAAFTDSFNIPESGNGIPDVLDEVRWETDWLKRMQNRDGSLALKVGVLDYVSASPPSSDHLPRYYVPSCSSATIAGAGMMAHAALVFGALPALRTEAEDLKGRALAAWRQYQAVSPKQTACDSGVVHAGLADLSVEDQNGLAVEAAVYLFAVTSDSSFEDYLAAHYTESHPYHDIGWSRYKADQGEALLFYSTLPTARQALARTFLKDKLADVRAGNKIYAIREEDDLYRAFLPRAQYHWGSNNPRANYGNTNIDVMTHSLGITDTSVQRERALGILHYLHGVNPFGMVYLTNMYDAGVTRSANEMYHVGYAAKTRWSDAKTSACGPPPGYLPGGPNADAERDGVPATLSPPVGQPPQKSYRDWNDVTPDSSWVVTEPGIYYQSAYVRLLSFFVQ